MAATRIPITMCHGTRDEGDFPLPRAHLATLVGIAADLGFAAIDYDDLAAWRGGAGPLPAGWHIGAHTVTHPNLSQRFAEGPDGERLRWELETCAATIERELGVVPSAPGTGPTGTSPCPPTARPRNASSINLHPVM